MVLGEVASFQFDYTDVDALGNPSNAAHVSFTVHGSQPGCIVGGRC